MSTKKGSGLRVDQIVGNAKGTQRLQMCLYEVCKSEFWI